MQWISTIVIIHIPHSKLTQHQHQNQYQEIEGETSTSKKEMKLEEHKEYIQEQSENIAYINLSVQLESTKRGITSI